MFLIAIGGGAAAGRIIYVDADTSGANDGSSWTNAYNYLQDGLTDANSAVKPVEIRVAEGIYTPDSNSADPNGSGDWTATFQLINGVTLRGGYAGFGQSDPNARDITAHRTILSGDLDGDDVEVVNPEDLWVESSLTYNSCHVVTASGTDPNAILDGFTITAGRADCWYEDDFGGGIYNVDGNPTVINCIFSANTAFSDGGGIFNVDGSPILTNCAFSGNSASSGGGVYTCRGNPKLTNCTFIGNTASGLGGGMYNYDGSPTLTNCTFSGNLVYGVGGGLFTVFDSATLTNCAFSGNEAGLGGGGVYTCLDNPKLTNCTFIGNTTFSEGGGMFNERSSPTLTNCTFTANSAFRGTALAFDSLHHEYQSNLHLTNCILWDGGNEIWNNDGSTITITYSDVQGGQTEVYDPCEGLVWGDGNIDAAPCFAKPGYWADANDPNIVVEPNDPNAIWIDGDYHLQSQAGRWDPNQNDWVYDANTSPCIDAGNPGCPLGDEPNDVNNIRINMGAYGGTAEASKSPANWALLADLTNDRIVDFDDLAVFVRYWLDIGECVPSDLTRNQSVDFADFALMALHWLECTAPECGVQVTDVKIIRCELTEDGFQEIEEVDEVLVGDIFIVEIEVSNFGSETKYIPNLYGWDLSPENCVEVVGIPICCLTYYELQPGESTVLSPFCPSQAFRAQQDGRVTMSVQVNDWYSLLCEHTFTFEVLPEE